MTRSRLYMLVAIVAGALTGCAHCDTCDDFPVPCTGPGCNTAMQSIGPAPMMSAPVMTGMMDEDALAPAPTITPPPLPDAPIETVGSAPEAPVETAPVPPSAALPSAPSGPQNR